MDKTSIKERLLRQIPADLNKKEQVTLKSHLDRVAKNVRWYVHSHSEPNTSKGVAADWICDNSYLAEQSIQTVLSSHKALPARLCDACLKLLDASGGVVNKEAVESLFEVLCRNDDLTDKEIRQIPAALLFCVLILVGELCRLDQGPAKELFTSIRFCLDFDYSGYINGFSPLERLLRCDPFGTYPSMDRASQGEYRKKLHELAKKKKTSLAKAWDEVLLQARKEKCDPSFILFPEKKGRYFLPCLISLFFVLFVGGAFFLFDRKHLFLWGASVLLLIPGLLRAATVLLRFFVSVLARPHSILKLKIDSCPDHARTCVSITELFSTVRSVDEAFEKLELLFLSQFPKKKRDPNLYFGIIADLKPSDKKLMPTDSAVIRQAQNCCQRLNLKYSGGFFCYLRQREYAPSEGYYCGKERKRGAIAEFARDVTGECQTQRMIGDRLDGGNIRYLVTLDSDTTVGFRRIYSLIGAMLHPNNRPIIKKVKGSPVVVKGHGILQPAIGTSLRAFLSTPFSVLQSGAGGREPYQSGGFDTYQDVYGVGMFCGKGILDLVAYHEVCSRAFPDGVVLSHDILEGSRLNCGYLREECFTDGVPGDTISYEQRRHRWIRGDVQATVFARKKVPNQKGKKVPNPIALPFRLALWDNLLTDLLPVFTCLLLSLTVAMNGKMAWRSAFLALLPLLLPVVLTLLSTLCFGEWKKISRKFYSKVLGGVWSQCFTFGKQCFSMAGDAYTSLDATLRSLWRLSVSKTKLLEWATFSSLKKDVTWKAHLKQHWFSLVLGGGLLLFSTERPARLFGLFWTLYPLLSYWLSKERKPSATLAKKHKQELEKYLSDSFLFFEQNVNAKGNFLPPDNISISPCESTAMRCSPTNVGLYLLSLLCARDASILTTFQLTKRLTDTLQTVERLEKHKGNLYNWYDTHTLAPIGTKYVSTVDSGNLAVSLVALKNGLEEYIYEDERLVRAIARIEALLDQMQFDFLFDGKKNLFYIGYNCETERPDDNHYDMYMSEARLTSYYCVAKGIVSPSHWYRLGRNLGETRHHIGALSWTGTCFEYFMPTLLLPVFKNSFESESLHFAFQEQKQYSFSEKKLFGVSESGFFAFDSQMNYQYRAFGVPSLRLKREKESTLVISPYSSFLMLKANPTAILSNLRRLKKCGMYGKYGFYEALDCNLSRTGGSAIVKSYMTHHVGMSMVAMTNLLRGNIFVKRFCREMSMRAASVLLEEKIPVDALILKKETRNEKPPRVARPEITKRAVVGGEKHFLYPGKNCALVASSHGRNQLVVKNGTEEFLFLKPFGSHENGGFIVCVTLGELCFSTVKNENPQGSVYSFYDYGAYCDYVIRHEKKLIRIRFLTLFSETCCLSIGISVSGYCGLAKAKVFFAPILFSRERYSAHPSFANLFVQIKELEEGSLMFIRRPREEGKKEVCAVAGFSTDERSECYYQFGEPSDFKQKHFFTKSNADIPLLYPQTLIAQRKMIDALHSSDGFVFCAVCGHERQTTKKAFLDSLKKMTDLRQSQKELSAKQNGVHGLSCDHYIENLFLKHWMLRDRNKFTFGGKCMAKEELWSYGISGDVPIFTLVFNEKTRSHLFSVISRKKNHFLCGIRYDLVVLVKNEGYRREAFDEFTQTVYQLGCGFLIGKDGGIHPVEENHQSLEFFRTISDLYVQDVVSQSEKTTHLRIRKNNGAEYTNGKFIDNGFLITQKSENSPPWSHVLCSKNAGTVIHDKSLGYTWWSNAAMKRITYWNNDAFSDEKSESIVMVLENFAVRDMVHSSDSVSFLPGEALYKGEFDRLRYKIRVCMHPRYSYKYVEVSGQALEPMDLKIGMKICPTMGEKGEYPSKMQVRGKADFVEFSRTLSSDRFHGAGFLKSGGDGRTGEDSPLLTSDGFLVAFRKLRVVPNQTFCFRFALGVTFSSRQKEHIERSFFEDVFSQARTFALEQLTKKNTTALLEGNSFFPFWLSYQTVFSRSLARSGFYQSGGAFGFRDQLQDSLAYLSFRPEFTKQMLLRCACHQFRDGDVLHWWHNLGPAPHRGVRTRCSDDYLWLVWVLCEYLEATHDFDILKKPLPFLEGEPLKNVETERYDSFGFTSEKETLLIHAIKAVELLIKRGRGSHGMPLMGCGDWNDGMNLVGENGGESVWLGMFSLIVLRRFSSLVTLPERTKEDLDRFSQELITAIDRSYNGSWYPRAWFADGTSLGNDISMESECSIDILPQAFSVFLYEYVPEFRTDTRRARMMKACENAFKLLFDEKNRVMRLFAPSFSIHEPNPGYIRGYVAGVRENGGQYTHGAVWFAWALYFLTHHVPSRSLTYRDMLDRLLGVIVPASLVENTALLRQYKNEPYVLSGDVYWAEGKKGRGGWSWYTGASGWLYRLLDRIHTEKKKAR